MMFNYFTRKRERKPPPPWLAWMMIGIVLYAMFASQQKGSEVNKAVERTTQNLDKQFAQMGEVKDKLIPSMVAAVRISEVKLGEGAPAVCGQTATITYDAWADEQTQIGDKATADNPLTYAIGHGKVMPAFERGVIGMQVGGKRMIYASSDMAYGVAGFKRDDVPQGTTVKFNIELLKLTPPMPGTEATAFRIIDTLPNTGGMILCGDKARAHIVIWGIDGKKLYSTKDNKSPIEFTAGKAEVFLGLEQGVIGMSPHGQRLLIVPPSFQKTMSGAAPATSFPLPKNETVLVDVEALP